MRSDGFAKARTRREKNATKALGKIFSHLLMLISHRQLWKLQKETAMDAISQSSKVGNSGADCVTHVWLSVPTPWRPRCETPACQGGQSNARPAEEQEERPAVTAGLLGL